MRVVLPFDPETFARTSVDPAGGAWPDAYQRLVAEASPVDVESRSADPDDDRVYHQHNTTMVDRALEWPEPTNGYGRWSSGPPPTRATRR